MRKNVEFFLFLECGMRSQPHKLFDITPLCTKELPSPSHLSGYVVVFFCNLFLVSFFGLLFLNESRPKLSPNTFFASVVLFFFVSHSTETLTQDCTKISDVGLKIQKVNRNIWESFFLSNVLYFFISNV